MSHSSFEMLCIMFYFFDHFGGHFGLHIAFFKTNGEANSPKVLNNVHEPNSNNLISNLSHIWIVIYQLLSILPILAAILAAILDAILDFWKIMKKPIAQKYSTIHMKQNPMI